MYQLNHDIGIFQLPIPEDKINLEGYFHGKIKCTSSDILTIKGNNSSEGMHQN
jgi:hypothetical protein